MFALPTPWYVAFGVLCLFTALVVARTAIALARHASSLVRSVGRANDSLRRAAADVTDEVEQATQTLNGISERRRQKRARR